MPQHSNIGSKQEGYIKGQLIRIGILKRTLPNCRDEVVAAFEDLIASHGDRPFTQREVDGRLLERGTAYAELTVYKAMQRMKEFDPRRTDVRLIRPDTSGFRLVRAAN